MRGSYGAAVAIALVMTAGMFLGSGYGGLYDQNPASGLEDEADSFNRTGNETDIREGTDSGSGDIVGYVTDGAGKVISILKFAVLLPLALTELGMPVWFAVPVGVFAQLGTVVSLVQFTSGRILR